MAIERTMNVLGASRGIWSGMRCWSGDRRNQYEGVSATGSASHNFTRAIAAPSITASEWYCLRIASKVAVAAENGVTTVAIGNDNDVGFVISSACNQPRLGFARVIGSSQIGVPNCASDLKASEFVL